MELMQRLFDGSLMPHGHCLLWRGDLLALHIGGDVLTSAAYFAIPLALISLVKKRDDLTFDRIFLMFAAFIFLCGVTHVVSMVNIWHGYYFIEGLAKLLTGLISALTAFMVWHLLPKAISIPSREALVRSNAELVQARTEILEANILLEQKVKERTAELEMLAIVDPLTGTFRRNHALEELDKELGRSRRHKNPLSVSMIDLDDFKHINDVHGHLAGDQVLQEVGALLKQASRITDTVGRFGGEEFFVVMPECDEIQAVLAAERFAKELREHRITLQSGEVLTITCSTGVAVATPDVSAQQLLEQADKAMYEAKHEGKDRVVRG